jgi:hypothetical protein
LEPTAVNPRLNLSRRAAAAQLRTLDRGEFYWVLTNAPRQRQPVKVSLSAQNEEVVLRAASTLIVVTLLHLASVTAVSAQPATAVTAAFLDISVGAMRPVSTAFTQSFGTVEADYAIPPRASFDLAGGVLLGQRFGVGVAVSHSTKEQPATVRVPPVFFGFPINRVVPVTASDSAPLQRSETAIHLDLIYRLPSAGRIGIKVFGGPSYFGLKQRLVSYFGVDQTGPLSFAVSGIGTELQDGSAWGFNIGADASYFFVKSFGVGALIRYSRTTVTLPNLVQRYVSGSYGNEDVDVGGFLVGGGLRLRF